MIIFMMTPFILYLFYFDVFLKEGDANISAINNEILRLSEHNLAEINQFKVLKEAEANKELYSKEFIQYNTARQLANNTKFYFSGQESLLGGVLSKIFSD